MKALAKYLVALNLLFVAAAYAESNLEQGVALSNNATLKALELKGFSLPALISQTATVGNLSNRELSLLPSFKPVLTSLNKEMAAFIATKPGGRLFDLNYLVNPNARFILVGVINRMDRGYQTGNRCGEIRFIYRLAYSVIDHAKPVMSRLPITINMVFRAGAAADNLHCAEFAKSWLAMNEASKSADWLTTGPLSPKFFKYENMLSLEVNLQAARQGAAAPGNFGGRADYLLKVYDWLNGSFSEVTLENQIDRNALIANPALMKELKDFLLDPKNLPAIDAGTLIIPKKFLTKKAFSIAPGGLARSSNRPFFNLFQPGELKDSMFVGFQQVKSVAGFIRRLNDSTCTGCHQTRAIGGFHFTGLDPFGKYPGNSVFLSGSPHFSGDLTRRRQLVESVAAQASAIDYSRGFSARPQQRRSANLEGSGLLNGWGAHCATGKDASFSNWTCAHGLVCKPLLDHSDDTGMGVCLSPVQQVGEPCEFGMTKTTGFGVDKFTRTNNREVTVPNALCSPQSQDPGTSTGGFLNGNIRKLTCEDGPGEKGLPPEANCGPLPAARPGFNRCIGTKNFDDCLKEFAVGVGLRGCDQKNPCRDDYICSESFKPDRGICAPPYFLFQFRVDGHPKGDLQP